MSSELDLIVAVGHDFLANKYYALATGVILFYDHLLTLGDEIEYFWSGRKSWGFWLFIFNRYFPMVYQFWILGLSYSSHFSAEVCEKTVFMPGLTFGVCTLLAQVVLTIRIYAATMKNVAITAGFAVITAFQLAVGIRMWVFVVRRKAQQLPQIPLDPYHLCVFSRNRSLEVAYTSISLFYDSLAFSLIIYLAIRSKASSVKIPTILGTMAEDATRYFLVIFTSHFVLEMTLILGRESIQLLPATGNVVYLPVMVSRIMLSLRKAAGVQQRDLIFGESLASVRGLRTMIFFRPWKGTNGRGDDVPLDTYPES